MPYGNPDLRIKMSCGRLGNQIVMGIRAIFYKNNCIRTTSLDCRPLTVCGDCLQRNITLRSLTRYKVALRLRTIHYDRQIQSPGRRGPNFQATAFWGGLTLLLPPPPVITSLGQIRLATESLQQVGQSSCRHRGSNPGQLCRSSTIYRESTWTTIFSIRILKRLFFCYVHFQCNIFFHVTKVTELLFLIMFWQKASVSTTVCTTACTDRCRSWNDMVYLLKPL